MNDYDAHLALTLAEQNEVEALRREVARLRREAANTRTERDMLLSACKQWVEGYDQHKRIIYCKWWECSAYDASLAAIAQVEGSHER